MNSSHQTGGYMKEHTTNRFAKEVADAVRCNPKVDTDVIRKFQEMVEILKKVPPASEPEEVKLPRLQPIPLHMFSR